MTSDCKTRITQAQVKSQEASPLVKGDVRSWGSSEGSTEIQGAYTGSGPVLEAGPALSFYIILLLKKYPGPGPGPAGGVMHMTPALDLALVLPFCCQLLMSSSRDLLPWSFPTSKLLPWPWPWSCRRWNVHSGDKQVKNTKGKASHLPWGTRPLPWIPVREADRDGPWGVFVVLSGPIGHHPGRTGLKPALLAFQGVNLG